MPSSKKVLFFTTLSPYPFWEGSEKFWFDFVCNDAVVNSDLECRIVLPESPATKERGKTLESIGAAVDYYTPYSHAFLRRNVNKTLQKFGLKQENYASWYNSIKKYSPALVWFNTAQVEHLSELSFAAGLCRDRKIPYWIILQSAPEHFFVEGEKEFDSFREIVEGAKRIVFASEKNKLTIEKAVGKKLANAVVSTNGLRPEFIAKAEKTARENPISVTGKARFLSIARFQIGVKGHHILLESLSSANWKQRDWELTFVGGGDPSLVKQLIAYFDVDPNKVKFLEKVSDILPVIGNNDLVLMPSLFEAGPYTVIEGMACGRPGIGTPVGDMPRHIQEGKTGWLAESTQVKHFADALERAWAARARWTEIGEAARKMVASDYNQSNYVPKLLDVMLSDLRDQAS